MAVQLKGRMQVKTPHGIEVGPLMADDRGVYVEAGRRLLHRARPGRYDLFSWASVTGYRIAPAAPHQVGGSTVNRQHCQLEVRTASGLHSWEIPMTQTRAANALGAWLAAAPRL